MYRHIFPNKKSYVGQAKQYEGKSIESSLRKRFGNNGYGYHTMRVYRAIEKYGWENIVTEVLETDIPDDYIDEKEKFYIEKFNSSIDGNGYNIENGGNGKKTVHKSTRVKISKAQTWQKGKNNPRYGKHCTDETKELIRKGLSEYYETHDGYWSDKKMPDSAREKLSKSTKERFKNKENHPMYGRKCSEIQKKILSDINSKRVLKYDLFGQYACSYKSATYAAKEYGCEISAIGNACHDVIHTVFDFLWFYEDEFSEEELKRRMEYFKISNKFKRFYYFNEANKLFEDGYNRQDVARILGITWDTSNSCFKMRTEMVS